MIYRCGICCLAAAILVVGLNQFAQAQWGRSVPGGQFELSDAVQVDRSLRLLESLRARHGVDANKALEYFCLMTLNLNEFIYLE